MINTGEDNQTDGKLRPEQDTRKSTKTRRLDMTTNTREWKLQPQLTVCSGCRNPRKKRRNEKSHHGMTGPCLVCTTRQKKWLTIGMRMTESRSDLSLRYRQTKW